MFGPIATSATSSARSGAFEAPLSTDVLRQALAATAPVTVETVESTGSTNADLLARARARAPRDPIVRATLEQTAGRGRMGRRWHAARGHALLFSIAARWRGELACAPAVTLACGVAVTECLRQRGVDACLKWPNDVLLDGRKLAGILAELAIDPDAGATLVVGIGLNLRLDPAQRERIGRPAADLSERIDPARLALERESWIGRLAAAALGALRDVERDGFAPFRSRFDERFAYRGRAVMLTGEGRIVRAGIARGVDDEGRLLIDTGDGLHAAVSGELSLREGDAPVAR
jgi:BirA family biotin operon repressor/biotin-[acetyl-CoA-carboxylase] ligase